MFLEILILLFQGSRGYSGLHERRLQIARRASRWRSALRAVSGESRGRCFCSHPAGCEFLGPPANVNRPLLIGVHLSVQENAFPSQRTWIDWLEIEFSSCVRTGSEMRKRLGRRWPAGCAAVAEFSGTARGRDVRAACSASLPCSDLRREAGPPSFQSWQQYRGALSVPASLRTLLSVGREEPAERIFPGRRTLWQTQPHLSRACRLTQPSYFSGRNDGVREG